MDHGNSGAHAFEEFRLQRKRLQARRGRNAAPGAYENDALRELERIDHAQLILGLLAACCEETVK